MNEAQKKTLNFLEFAIPMVANILIIAYIVVGLLVFTPGSIASGIVAGFCFAFSSIISYVKGYAMCYIRHVW